MLSDANRLFTTFTRTDGTWIYESHWANGGINPGTGPKILSSLKGSAQNEVWASYAIPSDVHGMVLLPPASERGVNEGIVLDAYPNNVYANDLLTLAAWPGTAGDSVGLALTAVLGVPTFVWLGFGFMDDTETWRVSGNVPTGLQGLSIDIECFGLDASGRLVITNVENVSFL